MVTATAAWQRLGTKPDSEKSPYFCGMLKMLRILFLCLMAFGLSGLPGCSPYQKVLKSGDYDFKFKKAKEYLDKQDYVRALPLYEELITIFRGTNRSEDCFFYYAYCHYGMGDYLLASYHFKNFYKTFPKSDKSEEAMFLNAYCYFLDSPRFSLDQSNTQAAINEFQLFVTMYPNSDKVSECNTLIDELRLKLQNKSFESARLYFHMGDYKAALVAFRNMLRDFPDSHRREEAFFMIVKSQYLLARNSVPEKQLERFKEVTEYYLKFIDTFPKSKFLREAESMYSQSRDFLSNPSKS
jgi:outer membrane protein assembly factor BamD